MLRKVQLADNANMFDALEGSTTRACAACMLEATEGSTFLHCILMLRKVQLACSAYMLGFYGKFECLHLRSDSSWDAFRKGMARHGSV